MKRIISVTIAAVLVLGVAGAALAWGPGMGPGWRMGGGPGGPGMGWRMGGGPGGGPGAGGPGACPMWGGQQGAAAPAAVTEEQAKATATEYADKYLKGYTVERVLPFTTGRGFTAYQVELKGPQGEARSLHITPWGGVRPFGRPFAAAQ